MSEARPVTAEEFMARGPERRQLIDGKVVEMTPAGRAHGRIGARFVRHLGNHAERCCPGEVHGADTGFLVRRDPDRVLVADAAFVSAARLEGAADRGWVPVAPDLVVEVVSPSESFTEVEAKVRAWLDSGTRLVWVVEPAIGRVFVYRPGGDRQDLGPGDSLSGEDVLPGLTLPVGDCLS
jgi:Uma2 family endonuclease